MLRGSRWIVSACVVFAALHPATAGDASHGDASQGAYEAAVREAGSSFGAGDTHSSLNSIERALAARPDGVGAHVLLSQIHLSLGHHQEAAAVLEHLVGIVGPGTPLGLDALTLQGYALGLSERYREAEERLASVLAAAPERPMTNMLLGRIHLQLGRCRPALEEFRRELDIPADRPQNSRLLARWSGTSAIEGLGLAAYQCGDIALAKQTLERIPEASLSLEGRHHIGLILSHEGKNWDAVRVFEKVLDAQPAHRGALLGLMRSAAAARLAPLEREAREKLAAINEADSKRSAARVHAGDLATIAARNLAAGDRGAATAALDQAAAITGDSFALSIIARHQQEAGDTAGAERTVRRILDATPFDADGHATMGIIQRERGDFAAAAASFERAAHLVPTDMAFRIRLAGAYFALGRTSDALAQLHKARVLDDAVTPRPDQTGLGAPRTDVIEEAIAAARTDARLGRGTERLDGTGPEFERILAEIDQDLRRKRSTTTLSRVAAAGEPAA